MNWLSKYGTKIGVTLTGLSAALQYLLVLKQPLVTLGLAVLTLIVTFMPAPAPNASSTTTVK